MTAGLSDRRFMKHRVNIIRAAFKRADAQVLFLKRKAKPGGNQGFSAAGGKRGEHQFTHDSPP